MRIPAVVVVCGPPCSGKSTLARALSPVAGLVHLEMDQVRARLIPSSTHGEADRDVAYRAMHLSAEVLLREGRGPLLDATYGRAASRLDLERVCRAGAAGIYLVECRVEPAAAVSRFEARSFPHPSLDLTPARVESLAREYPYCGRGVTVRGGEAAAAISGILSYLADGTPLAWDAGWSTAVPGAKQASGSHLSRSQSRPGGSSASS